MRNRRRTGWHKYINGLTIATLVTVLFIIIPLYWLVATSFKNPNSIGTSPPGGATGGTMLAVPAFTAASNDPGAARTPIRATCLRRITLVG